MVMGVKVTDVHPGQGDSHSDGDENGADCDFWLWTDHDQEDEEGKMLLKMMTDGIVGDYVWCWFAVHVDC